MKPLASQFFVAVLAAAMLAPACPAWAQRPAPEATPAEPDHVAESVERLFKQSEEKMVLDASPREYKVEHGPAVEARLGQPFQSRMVLTRLSKQVPESS